jgi:hypothetical protein
MSTGDLDEETPYAAQNKNIIGLRRRSWGQGHFHSMSQGTAGSGAITPASVAFNATPNNFTFAGVGAPTTDGTDGTPRMGKSTEAKSMGAALSLWMGRYVA